MPASTESVMEKPEAVGKKGRLRTLLSLSFGYFVDQGEAQAMSVLFPTLQRLWGLDFTSLGQVGTIRNLLQSLSAPVWGYLSDRFSRKAVIVFGTGVWGLWTLACGLTENFSQLLVIRAISGIGLGCLLPATFSIMSDIYPPRQRGRALGLMEGIGTLGIVLGVLALGAVATPELWRWGFILLGAFSVVSGIVIWIFVEEPVRGAAEPELEGRITAEAASHYIIRPRDAVQVLKIPTVWVAILQGLAGSMPWVVMATFFITWMVTDLGMVEGQATIAFAGIVLGSAVGSVLGGVLGDWADGRSPKYGRVIVGQVAIFAGVPLTWVLLTQARTWPFGLLVAFCFLTALIVTWAGKGAKEPMMQNAVPPEQRATAFAMTTFIEGGFAALVAYVAGRLADSLGLTQALIWTIPVPWIVCGLFFTLFYWAYPRDSARLRKDMAARAKEL
ncbi:MAG: MFS transporter [Anaerolineae bacterium]|nr:MAG: MFS transporter [Anaerolineae bacterium]